MFLRNAERDRDRAKADLAVRGLTRQFGGIRAVDGVDVTASAGSIVAVIGPNGAGKTTFLNLVGGQLRPQKGKVWIGGRETTGWPPHAIGRLGVIRTFQVARDFNQLTVLENMLVAPQRQAGERVLNAIFWPSRSRSNDDINLRRAWELLEVFDLREHANARASELSGGQRRLLELARAMMAEPKMLLLDEPTAGVSPALAQRLTAHLRRLRDEGITAVLVEHNLAIVEELSDSVVVMANGKCLATGTMATIRSDPAVRRAYLSGKTGSRAGG